MERDLFTREDLRNLIWSYRATIGRLPDCDWKAGFLAGLDALAVSVGLPQQAPAAHKPAYYFQALEVAPADGREP
jgi:hypothetical protein